MHSQTIEYRPATRADVSDIRDVACASLTASYGHALSDTVIEQAVDRWYDVDGLAVDLDDETCEFLVAAAGDRVVGFAQAFFVDRREPIGEIDWLHVHPDHRGEGVGAELLARLETRLRSRGIERVEGRVLTANERGATFYDDHGFTSAGERDVEIGDTLFAERLYTKFVTGETRTETRTTPDGEEVFVAYDEAERASDAPLYATYADRDRTERIAFLCGACGDFVDTMDSMGRIECDCGNRRKATRWDSAYL